MNKKEFIRLLEEKLKILEENELKDIINEYKDTIDEKVKHGKSEEEAVSDFGDVDELTKEILKAYKINPKYSEKKDNVKDVINDCESWIKRSAKKLANLSKNIYNDFRTNNNDLTIEMIFEILIKVIILLILFAVLRLPFELVDSLGKGILDIAFYPLDEVLIFLWQIIIFLLYFVCCVLISIAMFKNYFNKSENKKITKKKQLKKEKVETKDEIIREEKTERKKKNSNVLGQILKVIFQIFVVMCALLPLWMINTGLTIALILSIYYLCVGINTIGIILGTIGLLVLFGYTTYIFNSIAFNHKRIHFYPFLISLVFTVIGFLLTINWVFNIEYIEDKPLNDFTQATSVYELDINEITKIRAHDIEYIVDNSVENNKIKLEFLHYDELTSVNYYYDNEHNNYDYVEVYTIDNSKYNSGWKVYNAIIDNLKEDKIYNYDLLYRYSCKVYANETTMNLIKKD